MARTAFYVSNMLASMAKPLPIPKSMDPIFSGSLIYGFTDKRRDPLAPSEATEWSSPISAHSLNVFVGGAPGGSTTVLPL